MRTKIYLLVAIMTLSASGIGSYFDEVSIGNRLLTEETLPEESSEESVTIVQEQRKELHANPLFAFIQRNYTSPHAKVLAVGGHFPKTQLFIIHRSLLL